jgi:hypothetical protein
MSSIRDEIVKLKPDIEDLIDTRDSGAQLLRVLSLNVDPVDVATKGGDRVWELCGQYLYNNGRVHEALFLFLKVYDLEVTAQVQVGRVHKGSPLIWISHCFAKLGFLVHAKRYAMLALCEDAVRGQGTVPLEGGAYFQLMWLRGMRETELNDYAIRTFKIYQQDPEIGKYPEALLPHLGDGWISEAPSPAEAFHYVIGSHYAKFLLDKADNGKDTALEDLAEYLISCIAGCRCSKCRKSISTEYDLVCAIEGIPTDFRSEWGRYIVCECKNSKHEIDFSDFAKFCRVLDSVKAKVGIIISRCGIAESAEREQQKIFQDRGIIIVALDRDDLKAIVKGHNLIALLRERYEMTRLDLSPIQ